ncbi:MAG TPA: hemerythrin domain-containing protein [Acidimicrobiales bacterium]|nr:hemerythrin domain-containing protein [Acidimicrobiales bacterium]
MNALTLLKQDHGNVEELFHRFETADANDVEELARVRDLVIQHLSRHAVIEEQVFYPAIRARLGDEHAFTVLEGLEEHHAAKMMLSELEKLAPTHERFRAKFTVIVENVRHHVEEEESDMFPLVREAFTVEELNEMGEQMATAKAAAPTRPHPFIPDVPPFNVLLGVPVAMLDGAITAGKEAVGRLVHNGRG